MKAIHIIGQSGQPYFLDPHGIESVEESDITGWSLIKMTRGTQLVLVAGSPAEIHALLDPIIAAARPQQDLFS